MLLDTNDTAAYAVFPGLEDIYVRFDVDRTPLPSLEHVLVLEQYFASTPTVFEYQLDYWGHGESTGGMSLERYSNHLTDLLQSSLSALQNSEHQDSTVTGWRSMHRMVFLTLTMHGVGLMSWSCSNTVMQRLSVLIYSHVTSAPWPKGGDQPHLESNLGSVVPSSDPW